MDKYEELKCIGRGSYGSAHLVRERCSGGRFVVKKIPIELLSDKEKAQSFREVELLAKLKHPNVVEYKESFVDGDVIHIAMAYCDGGDLAGRIRERADTKRFFDISQILDWFVQMALAIKYLHEQRILHRDLKTSNVFLTTENVVKLGDFGIAKTLDSTLDQASTVVGTPYYMSPEVCESKPYSYASDVWALGCVLYELVALRHAFDAPNIIMLILKIVQHDFAPIPPHYDAQVLELLRQLLNKSPDQRPSMEEILAKPYIRNHMQGLIASGGSLRMNPTVRRPPGAIKRRVHPKNAQRRSSGERRRLRAAAGNNVSISINGGAAWASGSSPRASQQQQQQQQQQRAVIRWMPITPHNTDDDQVLHANENDLELMEASILEESQLNLRMPERSITPEPLLVDPMQPSCMVEVGIADVFQRQKPSTEFSPVAPHSRTKMAVWGESPSVVTATSRAANDDVDHEEEEEEEEEDVDSRLHAEAQELMNPNFQSEYSEECMDSLQIYYGSQLKAHRRSIDERLFETGELEPVPGVNISDATLLNESRWGKRRRSIPRSLGRSLDGLSLNKQPPGMENGDAAGVFVDDDAESASASLSESGILRELELEAESSDDESDDGDSSMGEYEAEENFYSDDSDFFEDNDTQYSDDFDDSDAEIIEYANDEFMDEDEGDLVATSPRLGLGDQVNGLALDLIGLAGAPGEGKAAMSPVGKRQLAKPTTEVQWVMRTVAQSLKESGESAA